MKDKIVIVTGANSGIGKETALELASRDATVILACRNPESGQSTQAEITAETGNDRVYFMPLDLASLDSVKEFAQAFQDRFDELHILINNAGLLPLTKQMTQDGFEMQFGVNHLGHFLLTKLLTPLLKKTEGARIISVSSMMHNLGKIDFDSFKGEKSYQPMRAYGQSKLANILFTKQLAKRLGTDGITAYSLHPGGVGTNIAGKSFIRRTVYKLIGGQMSPKRGAKTSIYLATEPGIESTTGGYYNEFCKEKPGSKLARDELLAERLWETSEQLLSDAGFAESA